MLQHLHIRNLAIVDAVEIDFRPGLTVLTGETGAGKSIVVDALQLATGGRGGAEMVRHGAERAEVVATFELRDTDREPQAPLALLLEEQSIDASDELVMRRLVTADGKSRGYLNGQQVPLQVLREVGSLLIDIHGQHEFQSLTRPAAQREQLDDFAAHQALVAEVAAAHREAQQAREKLDTLTASASDREARLDMLRYQVGEIETLALGADELPALLAEQARHANHGRLAGAARGALDLLYEAEGASAHSAASRALGLLRSVSGVDERLRELAPIVDEAVIRLTEAGRDLTRYLEDLEVDPQRQEFVEQRLANIEQLARKHRVTPAELLARGAELAAELASIEHLATDLESLKLAREAALGRWRTLAAELSASRAAAATRLEKAISTRMQTLGMAGGRFSISLAQLPLEAGRSAAAGLDQIEYFVSANPGQPPRPLAKVASGGELSRLSLAVQVTTAATGPRCMVFDEVDSGVGGAVAEIVGRELAALGQRAQVLCVTHLPQVAAQGSQQLRVAKLTDGKTTRTVLSVLGEDERVEELARMLGGVQVTDKARDHAREMLAARGAKAPASSRAPARAPRGRR